MEYHKAKGLLNSIRLLSSKCKCWKEMKVENC